MQEHGNIHFIRVSPNQKFKAMLQGQAIILDSRPDPYVFNDPTFRMGGDTVPKSFVNVTDKWVIPLLVCVNRHFIQFGLCLIFLSHAGTLSGKRCTR